MAIQWKMFCDECGEEMDTGTENTLDEMLITIKKYLRGYEFQKDDNSDVQEVCDECRARLANERPFQLYNY